jgi:hypothetical protein
VLYVNFKTVREELASVICGPILPCLLFYMAHKLRIVVILSNGWGEIKG